MGIVCIICSICAIIFGIISIILGRKRTIQLNIQQQQYLQRLKDKTIAAEQKLTEQQKELIQLRQEKEKALQQTNELIKNYQAEEQSLKSKTQRTIQEMQQTTKENKIKQQKELERFQQQIKSQKKQLNKELDKLKGTIAAAVENDIRQKQKKDKINFYKLSITDADLADVQLLQNLKASFHKPVVLSKLIWSQYFQKQMTDLCNRVLNNQKNVCGIYKITNLITGEHYIGQSKNIDDRWKAHCKCGLGIDASATNALYNSMQRDKIWNFTFELLEQCPPEQLNEKEAFWIDTYKSNIYGLNTQSGIKKRGTI